MPVRLDAGGNAYPFEAVQSRCLPCIAHWGIYTANRFLRRPITADSRVAMVSFNQLLNSTPMRSKLGRGDVIRSASSWQQDVDVVHLDRRPRLGHLRDVRHHGSGGSRAIRGVHPRGGDRPVGDLDDRHALQGPLWREGQRTTERLRPRRRCQHGDVAGHRGLRGAEGKLRAWLGGARLRERDALLRRVLVLGPRHDRMGGVFRLS